MYEVSHTRQARGPQGGRFLLSAKRQLSTAAEEDRGRQRKGKNSVRREADPGELQSEDTGRGVYRYFKAASNKSKGATKEPLQKEKKGKTRKNCSRRQGKNRGSGGKRPLLKRGQNLGGGKKKNLEDWSEERRISARSLHKKREFGRDVQSEKRSRDTAF